jgi:prophage antirepressor-like protein
MTRRTRHQLRCQCCGLLFPSMHPTAKWCSNACSQHAFRQRRKAAALVVQPTVIDDPDELPAAWRMAAESVQASFSFDGMQLRVTTDAQGVPWFVAADVCGALNLPDTHKAVSRLDDDERSTTTIPTPGGTQSMTTVNEPGLYSLILGSRKPEAKRFKRWVTHEVLPAIRRTGSYGVPRREPQLPQLPPAGPCIVIQASSYREAAQAWAEALEGAAVGAIRRRFSTVSRPGNLLPAGVHFLPLQA